MDLPLWMEEFTFRVDGIAFLLKRAQRKGMIGSHKRA